METKTPCPPAGEFKPVPTPAPPPPHSVWTAKGTQWPCPFCPPGTDHFERVSANGTVIEFQCAGCTYKHREPARGRSPLPLPVLDMELDEIAGMQVVQDVWVCTGIEEDATACPSTSKT